MTEPAPTYYFFAINPHVGHCWHDVWREGWQYGVWTTEYPPLEPGFALGYYKTLSDVNEERDHLRAEGLKTKLLCMDSSADAVKFYR